MNNVNNCTRPTPSYPTIDTEVSSEQCQQLYPDNSLLPDH